MGIQKQRMLAGELYIADDPELAEDHLRAMTLQEAFNASSAADSEGRAALLKELLGSIGAGTVIRPPMYCDYGQYITIGSETFVSFGATLLDVASITIGDDCQIGPHVQLLTPTHPLDPQPRREKWEAAEPISIGDNVWLGGDVIVCPGATIGENTVVGAGAGVTKNLPPNVLAVGNPAKIIRRLL